jgi:FkbM family methyltransferase
VDTAVKLGVDGQLRGLRAAVHPVYRRQRSDDRKLRLLLQTILTERSNCVDVGAYRGRMLEEIVRIAPRGRHIAYEPLPDRQRSLAARYPQVDVRWAAVSNETGEASFSYVKNEPARSGLKARSLRETSPVEQLTVRTVALDHDLPDGYVPALIKVDVEGAERQVFEGAIETIARYQPVIVFEHGRGGAPYYGTQPRHVYALLHDRAGLAIFDIDGDGPYTLRQFEEAFERDQRWDYVARPAIR